MGPLLSVDEVGEFCGIPDEEDGRVVEHPVKVPLVSLDLDRESSWVAGSVRRPRFTTNSREPDSCPRLVTDFGEDRCAGQVRDVVGHLEVAVSTGTLRMYDTLRDTLAVKVRKEVNVVEVLEE